MIDGKKYIAIWQPYFFPYIGYWQIIHAVDLFVVADNAHYIKQGRINRNHILGQDGKPQVIRINVVDASCNRRINEHQRRVDEIHVKHMLRNLYAVYHKAPHYAEAMSVIEPILIDKESDLTRYLVKQLRAVADYLGIETEIRMLSEVTDHWDCKAPEAIRRTCMHFGYTNYINSITGTKYYDKESFREMGINLQFLRRNDDICYKQFTDEFVPDLSIIDMMMFCSRDEIHDMLDCYHFVNI